MDTTLKKKTEEKSLTSLAFGWRVKKCSSPRVLERAQKWSGEQIDDSILRSFA